MLPTIHSAPFSSPRRRADRLVRLVLAGVALLLLALWAPADRPGPVLCTLRLAVGLPCPFCGMTRGVALCLHAQPLLASSYNLLTVPVFLVGLAVMALWAYEWLSNTEVRVRWPWRVWLVVVVVILANWAHQLAYRREDHFATSWLGRLLE